MKNCTIFGDLTSDKTRENYPEVSVCDDCVKRMDGTEDSAIVTVNGENNESDAQCNFCDLDASDE